MLAKLIGNGSPAAELKAGLNRSMENARQIAHRTANAALGERAEDIDVGRAETALKAAEERMKLIKGEDDYEEVRDAWARAVTRLGVAHKQRDR